MSGQAARRILAKGAQVGRFSRLAAQQGRDLLAGGLRIEQVGGARRANGNQMIAAAIDQPHLGLRKREGDAGFAILARLKISQDRHLTLVGGQVGFGGLLQLVGPSGADGFG